MVYLSNPRYEKDMEISTKIDLRFKKILVEDKTK